MSEDIAGSQNANIKSRQQYSCEYISTGIHFMPGYISACSANGFGPILAKSTKKLDWNDFQNNRLKIIEQFKNGIIPNCCNNCYALKEVEKTEEFNPKEQITTMFISHWYHCNSSCTYCVHSAATKGRKYLFPKNSKYYDVLPALKKLFEMNMISKDLIVYITGGEPTMLKEFSGIIDLLLENINSKIHIFTSAIKQHSAIEKALKMERAYLLVSIDSGNRALYKKIKRVDKFDQVVTNLKYYLSLSPHAADNILLKYILIKDVNDNIYDLTQWLYLVKQIGVKLVTLDIDYSRNYIDNNPYFPEYYFKIFDLFNTKCEELGLESRPTDYFLARVAEGRNF